MKFGRLTRIVAGCSIALVLALAGTPAWSNVDEDDPARDRSSPPMFDLFILRPLGIGALTIGTALFIAPVAPIALITRPTNIGRPAEKLVVNPVKYVFVDPLGEH
jgi:hypothetical protein